MLKNLFSLEHKLARKGQLLIVTQQDPTEAAVPGVIGAFDELKPTFLIRQAGGSKRVVLVAINLFQAAPQAGGDIDVKVVIDDVDRFNSGGTLRAPKSPHSDRTPSVPDYTVRDNFGGVLLAIAASANARVLDPLVLDAGTGSGFSLEFPEGVAIGATGSILIYTNAPTTAPSWRYAMKVVEEPFQ